MENKSTILYIILIIVIGGIVIFYFNSFNRKDNIENNDNKVGEQKEENIPKNEVDKKPEQNNSQNEVDKKPEQDKNNDNKTSVNKDNLKCTKVENTEYGKILYTNTYKFKYDKMTYGEAKIEMQLNSKYKSYRDKLLNELKSANKAYTNIKGISESSSKKSSGFTYILKIDATKVSAKELSNMGYRTLNYSGVKMFAYNNKYKCQ